MRIPKILVIAAWLCACTGGATQDGYVDKGKLSQLTVGKTTYSDVTNAWGQPTSSSTLADGRRVAVYPYVWLVTGATSGFGSGGNTDTKTGEVTLNFDNAGVLQSYQAPR